MSFSLYIRLKRYIYTRLFRIFFSHGYRYFGKKVSILFPENIQGRNYMRIEDHVIISASAWLLVCCDVTAKPADILKIGKNSQVGRFSHIVAMKKVHIGENVLIAERFFVSDCNHAFNDITKPILHQGLCHVGNVVIGQCSWIGENVSVIGASIGEHCVIGANSVVLHDIPPFSIAVGVPAKVIKRYNFEVNEWEKVK